MSDEPQMIHFSNAVVMDSWAIPEGSKCITYPPGCPRGTRRVYVDGTDLMGGKPYIDWRKFKRLVRNWK